MKGDPHMRARPSSDGLEGWDKNTVARGERRKKLGSEDGLCVREGLEGGTCYD